MQDGMFVAPVIKSHHQHYTDQSGFICNKPHQQAISSKILTHKWYLDDWWDVQGFLKTTADDCWSYQSKYDWYGVHFCDPGSFPAQEDGSSYCSPTAEHKISLPIKQELNHFNMIW